MSETLLYYISRMLDQALGTATFKELLLEPNIEIGPHLYFSGT